jgi:hypothetical protein
MTTATDHYYQAVNAHGYVMGSYDDEFGNYRMSWDEPQWGNCYDSEQECIDALLDWQQEASVSRSRPTLEDLKTVKIVKVAY